ncbi:MAG: UDP-N-acetylglucosamine 2-epimerase (non-hydrolyzing) [Planctomycetia bacterium]|nr:MAG: UDP-N-acetylglucosamine 2-epimerase (non-hydrolyzing) [Planctomycetia bacterium]RIK70227.1 MAG: UDP-N-acetylglucosamine 2-epimerase (non-hydrolyzing) [Planctomycetota bacterium]
MLKVMCICGARPNFMKIAPLVEAFGATGRITPILVHTGQHYDERMSDLFFRDLGIPKPDVNLEVGSGSHAVQTAEIMRRFEPVLLEHAPDWVVVVGDVNSTIACGLVAVKLGVKLAHVEAGLRSFDRTMPEEINRILTDAISDLLLVSDPSGVENLRREGVPDEKVRFVGNVMIDTLLKNRARADLSNVLETFGLRPDGYAVVTLHRPSNVDDAKTLGGILDALATIARDMPIIFPMHPRTRKNIAAMGLDPKVAQIANFVTPEPLGYLDFLKLMAEAAIVLTDSGGVQEETTILDVPCLTLRENTERPSTISDGTNKLVGPEPARILAGYRAQQGAGRGIGRKPPLWDGKAALRIAEVFLELHKREGASPNH